MWFVPHDRIFLNGETKYCGGLVNYFATWHRANYGGCKGGNADVLIGATAKMTKILGTEKNAIVKDKLIEMIPHERDDLRLGDRCQRHGNETALRLVYGRSDDGQYGETEHHAQRLSNRGA